MTHINQRVDTASNWASANPVLQLGEVGWEKNTRKAKLGDGVTAWNSLPYAIEAGGVVLTVAGKEPGEGGNVALNKHDIGLPNVNNTADADKPISVAQQAAFDDIDAALDDKAPLASPEFTGNPKAPTPGAADDDTSIATTAFVRNVVDATADHDGGTIVLGDTRIQWGSIVVTLTAESSKEADVVFPDAFSDDATMVQLTVQTATGNKLTATVNSAAGEAPSTTDFRLTVKTGDGTNATATPTVYWLAIGPA